MLTDAERQVWRDIERRYAAEFERCARATMRTRGRSAADRFGGLDPSTVLVAGARVTIVLILLGAVVAGLVVGGVTGLAGLLRSVRFEGWWACRGWPRRHADPGCSGASGLVLRQRRRRRDGADRLTFRRSGSAHERETP